MEISALWFHGQVPVSVERVVMSARRPHLLRSSSVPAVVGTACAVVGLLDVAAGVFPGFRHSHMRVLAGVFPGVVSSFAAAASVVTGILMLMLAHALKRGKKRAWRAAVLLLPVGAAAQVLHRHSLFGALISMTLLALLLFHRAEFSALSDPRSR